MSCILAIDDRPINREFLVSLMTGKDYAVPVIIDNSEVAARAMEVQRS